MSEILMLFIGAFIAMTWVEFTITPVDIVKYEEVCSKNEGLEKITRDVFGYSAKCKDGAKFTVKGE